MRRIPILEAGVALATALSLAMVGAMLAAPWLPQPTEGPLPLPSVAAPSTSPETDLPPLGLFLLRGPFSFGPCLALELGPEAYPVESPSEGTATVLSWERGMTGCDSRTGDVREIPATVSPVTAEDGAGDRLVGYALDFDLETGTNFNPLGSSPGETATFAAQITILVNQSTPILLQALDTTTQGAPGLVFDRVPSVNPRDDPRPSDAPTPSP
jgi:hypothetical protein